MSYIVIVISSVLLISSCGSSEESKNNQHHSTADSIEKPANMSDDTKADTIPTPESPGPGLSPGQAEVKAQILEILEVKEKDRKIIRLQIREVLKYGRTTSPIATDDTLTVPLRKTENSLKTGQQITIILQQNIISAESKPVSAWSLVKVKD